jgi:hypothetical protein
VECGLKVVRSWITDDRHEFLELLLESLHGLPAGRSLTHRYVSTVGRGVTRYR